jgi:hypothetical protein
MRCRSATPGAVLAACAALAATSPLAAQEQFGSLSYMWSLPTADTKSFTNNNSWLGFALDVHKFVNPDQTIAASALIGWNEFYWNTSQAINFTFHTTGSSVQNGVGTVQGLQYRDYNVFPFLVGADYYAHLHGSNLQPFAGAYLGLYYIHQTFDISTVEYTTNNWIFGFAPEVGVRFFMKQGEAVSLYARYNWPVSAGSFLPTSESRTIQYFSIGIGLGFGH